MPSRFLLILSVLIFVTTSSVFAAEGPGEVRPVVPADPDAVRIASFLGVNGSEDLWLMRLERDGDEDRVFLAVPTPAGPVAVTGTQGSIAWQPLEHDGAVTRFALLEDGVDTGRRAELELLGAEWLRLELRDAEGHVQWQGAIRGEDSLVERLGPEDEPGPGAGLPDLDGAFGGGLPTGGPSADDEQHPFILLGVGVLAAVVVYVVLKDDVDQGVDQLGQAKNRGKGAPLCVASLAAGCSPTGSGTCVTGACATQCVPCIDPTLSTALATGCNCN